MEQTLKQAIEAATKAQEDFKLANEQAQKQLKEHGRISAELAERVEKLSASVDEKLEAAQKRWDDLERRANRSELFGGASDKMEAKMLELKAFNRQLALKSGGPGKPLELEAYEKLYKPAFWAFVRGKEQAVGRLGSDYRAALSVGSDPSGGYQVPADVTDRVVTLIYETSPMRRYAGVRRTSRDRITIHRDVDQAVTGGWVGEAASRAATATPQVPVPCEIPVHEQYAFPLITQQDLDDADMDLEAWLTKKLADRFARDENTGFLTGTGIAKPRGFLTYANAAPTKAAYERIKQVKTGVSANFAAAPHGPDIFVDLLAEMKEEYLDGAVWAMSRATLGAARKLKDSQGGYQVQLGLGLSGRPGFEILGFPVVRMADMPAIGANSLSIAFANFAMGYQVVDHASGMRVLRDPFTQKPNVGIYAIKRTGGDVADFDAIKLAYFGS